MNKQLRATVYSSVVILFPHTAHEIMRKERYSKAKGVHSSLLSDAPRTLNLGSYCRDKPKAKAILADWPSWLRILAQR